MNINIQWNVYVNVVLECFLIYIMVKKITVLDLLHGLGQRRAAIGSSSKRDHEVFRRLHALWLFLLSTIHLNIPFDFHPTALNL